MKRALTTFIEDNRILLRVIYTLWAMWLFTLITLRFTTPEAIEGADFGYYTFLGAILSAVVLIITHWVKVSKK